MKSADALKTKILESTSLASIVGEQVSLTERGHLRVGCCPFHEERSPSFTVYPDHYFCFGCKESGDAITFVRKTKGFSFVEALHFLGQKAGIDTSDLEAQRSNRSDRLDEARLFRIMLAAQDYFRRQLRSGNESARKACAYLEERGFSTAQRDEFGIGLALDEPRGLLNELTRQKISVSDLETCSLVSHSAQRNQFYDFFRHRIMIPIFDAQSRLVGFGGRTCDPEIMPKYKNSRESRLFDKSNLLFGLNRARDLIRKGSPVIIVEGYMDTLQLWMSGFGGTVACMGTALKTTHMRHLNSLGAQKIFLIFDGDAAGQKASLSTVSIALEFPRLDLRVVVLPTQDDPDTFVKKNGADALKNLMEESSPLIDFAIQGKLRNQSGLAAAEIVQKDLLPWVLKVEDPFKRNVLLNRICGLSGLDREVLDSEISRLRRGADRPAKNIVDHSSTAREAVSKVEGAVKSGILATRPLAPLVTEIYAHLYFGQPESQNLKDVMDFVRNECDVDEAWIDLLRDFFDAYARNVSPSKDPMRSRWGSLSDPAVVEAIDWFNDREAAFVHRSRVMAVEQLKKQIRLKKRQAAVVKLRTQLGTFGVDANEILRAIRDLQSEMNQIQAKSLSAEQSTP